MISTSAAAIASNFSASVRKPRWRIRGCFGIGRIDLPMSTSCSRPAHACGVRLEVLEQLLAALVLVDAPHVDRKRAGDAELLAEALGLGGRRARPSRRRRPYRGRSPVPAALRIMARSSNELNISARTPRKIGGKIAKPMAAIPLGRRHQHRLAIGRADAVVRVAVAVAEEDERSRTDRVTDSRCTTQAPGSSALRCRATPARQRASASCSNTRSESRPNSSSRARGRPGSGAPARRSLVRRRRAARWPT